MANLTFSSDLIEYALFEGGEKTDGTSDFDSQALIWLNENYRKIWQGGGEFDPDINEDWVWLRKDGNLILDVKITTGTVSVTNNSATATLSASQATDVAGRFFKVDTHEGVFKISTHGGASATLTLDSVYTGDTNATASYKIVRLDYTLASDAIEVLAPMTTTFKANRRFVWDGSISGVSLESVPWRTELLAGIPEFFSQISETEVRFNRYADDDLIRLDYRYKLRPSALTDSGSEEPALPLHHRHILANMTLFNLLRVKNDDRAEFVSLQAKAGLQAMAAENKVRLSQMDRDYGRVRPRGDYYNPWHSFGRIYQGEAYS